MKIENLKLYEYLEICALDKTDNKRKGQDMFNALYHLNAGLANHIRCGPHDPFYDDTKVKSFLSYIAQFTNFD